MKVKSAAYDAHIIHPLLENGAKSAPARTEEFTANKGANSVQNSLFGNNSPY